MSYKKQELLTLRQHLHLPVFQFSSIRKGVLFDLLHLDCLLGWFSCMVERLLDWLVFNANLSNISAISWCQLCGDWHSDAYKKHIENSCFEEKRFHHCRRYFYSLILICWWYIWLYYSSISSWNHQWIIWAGFVWIIKMFTWIDMDW